MIGSITVYLVTELTLATRIHELWNLRSGGMPPLSQWLRQELRWMVFAPILMVLSVAVVTRGRRPLFALPALVLTFGPALIDAQTWSSTPPPGIMGGGAWILGVDLATNPTGPIDPGLYLWGEAIITLLLILLPGILAARSAPSINRAMHPIAVLVLGGTLWSVTWMSIVMWNIQGRASSGTLAAIAAMFLLAMALGYRRPWWPWALLGFAVVRQPSMFSLAGDVPTFIIALAVLSGPAVETLSERLRAARATWSWWPPKLRGAQIAA